MGNGNIKFCIFPSDLIAIEPHKARDLIVKCFFHAQRQTFERARKALGIPTEYKDLQKSTAAVVKLAFKEAGYDFEKPSKEALVAVIRILAGNATVMGTSPDVVSHHRGEIQKIIGKL